VQESDKQVVWSVSTQAPVDWRLGEWGDKLIGVYTDANIVMGAESADFFFYCWYLKVLTEDGIVPGASTVKVTVYILSTVTIFRSTLELYCDL
jgi:hypothetical protein